MVRPVWGGNFDNEFFFHLITRGEETMKNKKQKDNATTLKAMQAIFGSDLAKLAAGFLARQVRDQVETLGTAMMTFAETRDGAVDAHGGLVEAARSLDDASADGAEHIDVANSALINLEAMEAELLGNVELLRTLARAAGCRPARRTPARKMGRHEASVGKLPSHLLRARKAPAYGDLDEILEFLGKSVSADAAAAPDMVAETAAPKDESPKTVRVFGEDVTVGDLDARISSEITKRVSTEVANARVEWARDRTNAVQLAVAEARAELNRQITALQGELEELESRITRNDADAKVQAKRGRQEIYEAVMAFVPPRDRNRLNMALRTNRFDVNFRD